MVTHYDYYTARDKNYCSCFSFESSSLRKTERFVCVPQSCSLSSNQRNWQPEVSVALIDEWKIWFPPNPTRNILNSDKHVFACPRRLSHWHRTTIHHCGVSPSLWLEDLFVFLLRFFAPCMVPWSRALADGKQFLISPSQRLWWWFTHWNFAAFAEGGWRRVERHAGAWSTGWKNTIVNLHF